jgi:hypothetical protein
MTREEVFAQLALVDDHGAVHPSQAFEAEQVLDWAVARGRIPPFANRLARALAAETMREALRRARVRIDADGTVSERDVDMSDSAVDADEAFQSLMPRQRAQPAPPARGRSGDPPRRPGPDKPQRR